MRGVDAAQRAPSTEMAHPPVRALSRLQGVSFDVLLPSQNKNITPVNNTDLGWGYLTISNRGSSPLYFYLYAVFVPHNHHPTAPRVRGSGTLGTYLCRPLPDRGLWLELSAKREKTNNPLRAVRNLRHRCMEEREKCSIVVDGRQQYH